MRTTLSFRPILIAASFLLMGFAGFAQKASFNEFLQQFPKATLPYTIDEAQLQYHLEVRPVEKLTRLPWEFYELLPDLEENMQQTSMPVYPEPVACFETKKHYALLYNTGRKFAKQFKVYNLAIFDKQGNYIVSRCIGGANPTSLASVVIDADLTVTIKEYRVQWAKDYMVNGLEENKVTALLPVRTRTFDAKTAAKTQSWDFVPATDGAAVLSAR